MEKIIVLVISGKKEDVFTAKVYLFGKIEKANEFIEKINENSGDKYWDFARIVKQGINYELGKTAISSN